MIGQSWGDLHRTKMLADDQLANNSMQGMHGCESAVSCSVEFRRAPQADRMRAARWHRRLLAF